MKCLNCGARVKKSEEICPECGAYISTEKERSSQPETVIDREELEKAEEAVKHIYDSDTVKYDYNDYLLLPSLLKIGGGIAMFVFSTISIVRSVSRFASSLSSSSSAFIIIVSVLAVFSGIATIFQEKNCIVTVTEDRIFGTIPGGTFDTENIDIRIEDIIAVNETGFYSKASNPKVHIVTAENEVVIRGSSKTMLSDLSSTLKNRIKENAKDKDKEKENENEI